MNTLVKYYSFKVGTEEFQVMRYNGFIEFRQNMTLGRSSDAELIYIHDV